MRVLDHGYIELASFMGSDLTVINAARVSYSRESSQFDTGEKRLLRYLLSNNHTSPFEHVVFTFNIKAPMFVIRQWQRHRTWSFNEVSARYTQLPDEFYVPDPSVIGRQSTHNKQVRNMVPRSREEVENIINHINAGNRYAYNTYKILLETYGVPRELARSVLPFNIYSSMYGTCDLHNLLGFLKLRNHEHAQWEIQEYARAIEKLIEPVVPETLRIWKELNEAD